MRTEFFRGCSLYFVRRYCPWAAQVVKVPNGCWAFESLEDFKAWRTANDY